MDGAPVGLEQPSSRPRQTWSELTTGIAPRLLERAASWGVPVPGAVALRLRRLSGDGPVIVRSPRIVAERLEIAVERGDRTDHLRFGVPLGFRTHPDLVAAAVAPIVRGASTSVEFDFPVSPDVRAGIARRSSVDVKAPVGESARPAGQRIALNYSGGVDSLAGWLLSPPSVLRISVDFGNWFARERRVFRGHAPDLIIPADFRSTGFGGGDWLFMAAPSVLAADHLDLGWIGFAQTQESSTALFRTQPKPGDDGFLPPYLTAVGLGSYSPTIGLTNFATSLVIAKLAPRLASSAMSASARPNSIERRRKQLIHECAVEHAGGPSAVVDSKRLRRAGLRPGQRYGSAYTMMALLALHPRPTSRPLVSGLDPEVLADIAEVRPDFLYRCNPHFLGYLPESVRSDVIARMSGVGIEMYRDEDWAHYEAFHQLLGQTLSQN